MQKDDRRILTFAAIVCVTCSLLLSGAAAILKTRQDYNVELDRKLNVLKAFGVDVVDAKGKRNVSADEVEAYFTDYISEVILGRDTGAVLEGETSADLTSEDLKSKVKLPLYLWKEDGRTTKYAFPISGYGLWSTLYGYMALEGDLATVIGVTFYKHNETPGLGGEASAPWFQKQFGGKKVWADGGLLPFEVVKGGVDARYPDGCDHCVDGISAETITSYGIQDFIREDLENYETYFKTIRGT